jgi:hypothetical protein
MMIAGVSGLGGWGGVNVKNGMTVFIRLSGKNIEPILIDFKAQKMLRKVMAI